MTDTFADLEAADKDFYLVYGQTMAAWAMLERSVAELFARINDLPAKRANAIFFSANSFKGRYQMAQAGVRFAKTLPPGKSFLTRYLKLASTYSDTRNQLAHDNHQAYFRWEDGIATAIMERRIEDHVSREGLTVDQIQTAGINFRYLSFIVPLSMGQTRLLREPELSLELLRLMPENPVARSIDLNEANRLGAELQRHSG